MTLGLNWLFFYIKVYNTKFQKEENQLNYLNHMKHNLEKPIENNGKQNKFYYDEENIFNL